MDFKIIYYCSTNVRSRKTWVNWNSMQSLQDSTKGIRIDRKVRGYAPFIPREDAPYYSTIQINEIQISLEKILNPDIYFAEREDFMKYYQEFIDKFVFIHTIDKK